jgi:hypothetical protein
MGDSAGQYADALGWRYAGNVNDREFRRHLAELLANQRNPDQPSKKSSPRPEASPKTATMSNKDFQQHIRQLLAQQSNQDQKPPERKAPASEKSKPPAVTGKKPPATVKRLPFAGNRDEA